MCQERIKMNKLKDVLRLHFQSQLSNRQISRALKIAASTVGYYVKAARQAELDWDQCQSLDPSALIQAIEPYCQQLKPAVKSKADIDLSWIHQQLKLKGVTRELLWQEYCQGTSLVTYSYTEFCRQYRGFKKCQQPSMRQTHHAGEKAFVDYAGPKIPIYHTDSSHIDQAMIFVGILGASNYTFAEATLTRSLPDWLGSHVRMLEYFGGVPALIVPDNEKSGVNHACYYEPQLNDHYAALAAHYHTAILPTRPRKPQDKAKVEAAVLVVERWILARLRQHKFFSLDELNKAISKLLIVLNQRPFKKLPGSRQSQFQALDQPVLKPLPQTRYVYTEIKKCQVRLDYHIEVNTHLYSVPHQLIGKTVQYQLGEQLVEAFYQGERIASHLRNDTPGKATTVIKHMPHAHQQHRQWSPKQFSDWAASVGSAMEKVACHLITHQPHPECCYRIHMGFMNLVKRYDKSRLEVACCYALKHHLLTFNHIRSILQTQCDQAPCLATNDNAFKAPTDSHEHVRGSGYYSQHKETT